MIKNVNTSSFKQKIHYPNLTINEVSHLFKQSPLLHTTNDLRTKSLIASDVRGHFKSNVRSLLAENYKDIVTNDSNGNGKSGQVHKTTTVYLLRQLLISLQSLNPAEQNKLGVTKHIQEIQLALETIRSQNFIKMNLQIESSKASTKIETIDIHESLPVGEDNLDNLFCSIRELSKADREIFTARESLRKNINEILTQVCTAVLNAESEEDTHLLELKAFAQKVNADSLNFSHNKNILDDFIKFDEIIFSIENDPEFKDRLALLPYEILISPETAISFLLSLGQIGKTLLCAMNTEYSVFDSRDILAKGTFTIYTLLGYRKQDFIIDEKYDKNVFKGKTPLIVRLRQMIASIEDPEKRNKMLYYVCGDLNYSTTFGIKSVKKRGFLDTLQNEIKGKMEAAASDVTEYLGNRIAKLGKHTGRGKAVSSNTQVATWIELLEASKKLSAKQRIYTTQTKNSTEILKDRIAKAKCLITNIKTKLVVITDINLDQLLSTIPKTDGDQIPLKEYLEKTEKKIYEALKLIFKNHSDILVDDAQIKSDWSFFQKSYIITQQNILGLIARNSTVSVGMKSLKGDGGLEILQTQLVEKCGEVSSEARKFKTELETNEDLNFIRKTLAEAGIFEYIISKNDTDQITHNIDVRRFLSRSPEATESARKLNALKENYLDKVLKDEQYAEIRHLLVATFTINGTIYKLNLGSQKIFNELGIEVQLTDRTGFAAGTIEFDTESFLGKKDSSARRLVAQADKISRKLSQLINAGDKAQEIITDSFDEVVNAFFTGPSSILTGNQLEQFKLDRAEYITKRDKLRKDKNELSQKQISLKSSQRDLELLLKKPKAEQNADDIQALKTSIKELEKEVVGLKTAIDALILNIKDQLSYSKFIKNIFASADNLPKNEETAFTNTRGTEATKDNLGLEDFENKEGRIQVLDGFFFHLSDFERTQKAFGVSIAEWLLKISGKNTADSKEYCQNPDNQASLGTFVKSILQHQKNIAVAVEKQVEAIQRTLAAFEVETENEEPVVDEIQADAAQTTFRPLAMMRNGVEALKTQKTATMAKLRSVREDYLRDALNQQRHVLTAKFLNEQDSQDFVEAMLEWGCTRVSSKTITTESPLLSNITLSLYKDPGPWTYFLAPNTEDMAQGDYIEQLHTMINMLGMKEEVIFNPDNEADALLRDELLAEFENITKIYSQHNYKTFKINWGNFKNALKEKLDNPLRTQGDLATHKLKLEEAIQLLDMLNTILTSPKSTSKISEIEKLIGKIWPILKEITNIASFSEQELALLNRVIEKLNFQDIQAFGKMIDELYKKEDYQAAKQSFENSVKRIFKILEEKGNALKKSSVSSPRAIAMQASDNVAERQKSATIRDTLSATSESMEQYVKEAEKCHEAFKSAPPAIRKQLLDWKGTQINYDELDRELRNLQNFHAITALSENISLYAMTMKIFLTKHNLLNDFLYIEKTMTKLDKQDLVSLSDTDRATFTRTLETLSYKLYLALRKEGLRSNEKKFLESFAVFLNFFLPKSYEITPNNPVWQTVSESADLSNWTVLGILTAPLRWLAAWYVRSPDINIVDAEPRPYIEGYRTAFRTLKSQFEGASFESMNEHLIALQAEVDLATTIFNDFNDHTATILEFYKLSLEFQAIHDAKLFDSLEKNSALTYCREHFFNDTQQAINIFSIKTSDMQTFIDKFKTLKEPSIFIFKERPTYSVVDLLTLPKIERTVLLKSIQDLYHISETEFTFQHLLELALNRKTTLLIKGKNTQITFNLSLDQIENHIIILYKDMPIDPVADLRTIASNIDLNRAALAEHNSLVNKAKENIAKLKSHFGLDVPSDAFVELEALTHAQLIQDPTALDIDDSTLAEKIEALKTAAQKIVLGEGTPQIEIEGLLEETQEIYFVGNENARRKLTLEVQADHQPISISVTYSHTVLKTSSTPDVQSILTAVQTTVATHEEELAAIADVRENPNTTLVPDSTLAEKHVQVLAQIESNKKFVQILSKLQIQDLPDIKDFEFNTTDLFFTDDVYNASQDVKQKKDIYQRSQKLLNDLNFASEAILQCKKELNVLFEKIKTELCGDNYTCTSDLFLNKDENSQIQLKFKNSDKGREEFLLDIGINSLDFTTTIEGRPVQSHLELENIKNLDNKQFISVHEIAEQVQLVHEPWEKLITLALKKDWNLEEISKILNLKEFALNSIVELSFEELNNNKILTLKIEVYGKKITLILETKFNLNNNKKKFADFKDNIDSARNEFLENINIVGEVSEAQKSLNVKILEDNRIISLMPTQIIFDNDKNEIQRVINNKGETLVNKLLQSFLDRIQINNRRCILIHNTQGKITCGISFERKGEKEFDYRVFGKIIDDSINKILKILDPNISIKFKRIMSSNENVRCKIKCSDLNTFNSSEIIIQLMLEKTKPLKIRHQGLYTKIKWDNIDYRYMRLLPIIMESPTQSDTITEVEESNIFSLLNGTVKKTLHLNTNTYASTLDTIRGKRSSFNSYISSTSNSNYENEEKVLEKMPGSANLMMKSYPKDNEIFSHSNKAKNRVFNEDFFIVF